MPMKYQPTRNTYVILIFGGGMLLFILLAIFPNYISYNNTMHEISILKDKIDEQKILSPIFEDLSKKAQFKNPGSLPFPPAEKLPRSDTEKITPIIREIVEVNGFTLKNIDTDIASLVTDSGILKMSIGIVGKFNNLRNLMLDLGSLPYLEHIEVIQISSFGDDNKIDLTIWIAQDR
ncbi:MAG: hypothetical protein DRI24_08680 [Deltaproteobacteria bacterium]|nr:MAG: hypothetical protein DRI24_08680 [Deltaproteobacteria bacterium]